MIFEGTPKILPSPRGDGESISDGNQVMSDNESSDNDWGTTDNYIYMDDVTSQSSDDSDDSNRLLQGNLAISTASPEDNMSSEDLESGVLSSAVRLQSILFRTKLILNSSYYADSEENDNDLFIRLARWSQDIPRNKYIELKHLLESQGIVFPSLRRQSE